MTLHQEAIQKGNMGRGGLIRHPKSHKVPSPFPLTFSNPARVESWMSSLYSLEVIFAVLRVTSEKAMATHSSTRAWKIPWTEEPGRLLRVGHDRETSLSLFTFMHWRRKWQPTPAFLPGESQGRGSLVGCHLWGRTESDTTEAT